MDIQIVERMRHLWKDGRAKYASFFACLQEVRQEVGDAALERWCRANLLISLDHIEKAAKLLPDVDAQKTKQELALATRIAQEEKLRKREEKAEQRALHRLNLAKRQTELARQIAHEEKARKRIEERIRKPAPPSKPRNKKGFRVIPHALKAAKRS